jgi:signal transduction histidine kinase/CheY-like chemotaxis protein
LSERVPRVAAAALGLYALIGGAVSFIGWAADLPLLADWDRDGIAIQPNTTIAAILSGAALLLLSRGYRRATAALGGLIALIGSTVIVQYLSGIDLGIDTLFMFGRSWGQVDVLAPGRMGPLDATSWTLIGATFVLASLPLVYRARALVPGLGLLTAGLSSLSLIGHLYGASVLYTVPTMTVIALQTAAFILAVSLGLVASAPEHGPMRLLSEDSPAGILTRRALPVVIAAPLVIGFVQVLGERAALYDSAFGSGVRTICEVALFLILLLWTGDAISRHARRRLEAEASLRVNQQRLSADLAAMTRLQDLSTRLVQGQDLDSLLREILAAAANFTLTDKGNIQFYDPATGRLRIVVHQGLGPRLVEHFAEDGCAATCGAAGRQAERVIIEDVATEPSLQGTVDLEIMLEDGIRGILSTPLVSRDGRLLGMLNNHFRVPTRPSERELRYLDLLARMAADVVERAQAEEALRQADRRKDEFLATLSHELRNPLAPLQTAVDILKTKGSFDRELAWASDVAGRQVRVMARLLEDLLDVSRITRDRLELHKGRVELSSVLRGALETCGPLFERLSHELSLDLPGQPIWLDADAVRLGQVFGNLFNNACKYTPPKGRVSVTAEARGGEAVIRIKDTGIGIPPDKLASIFDIFFQVDRSLERSNGGMGIGLHLVKRLVELHGGTVEAHSAGEKAGSEFIVRLPLIIEETVAAGSGVSAEPFERTLAAVSGGSTRRIGSGGTPSWRILVVDDNWDSAESLALLLARDGHETETAHDGLEAVEKAATYDPHVILLDIGLPGMNGYDACREIRKHGSGHAAPLMVALTGWGQEADREKARQAGFDAHVVKPVLHDNLMSLLASLSNAPRSREL